MSSAARVAHPETRNRLTLIWIMLFCASPFVLATLFYFFWKPAARETVGVFLDPKAALEAPLLAVDGSTAPMSSLRGKWLLLSVTGARCEATCLDTLHRSRQFRVAQAEQMDRVQRVLLAAAPAAATDAGIRLEDAVVRIDAGGSLQRQLPVGPSGQGGAIYLIDPNGNLVMRYDPGLDAVKVIREMKKIIKINNGLG